MTLIERLESEYEKASQKIDMWRGRQRFAARQIDAARLATRPTFPTDAQHAGIAQALENIAAGMTASTHHGDPAIEGDYTVCWTERGTFKNGPEKWGWISVRHNAPYQKEGVGKLWDFTAAEVEAILQIVSDSEYQVYDHWQHAEGVSIVVAPKS